MNLDVLSEIVIFKFREREQCDDDVMDESAKRLVLLDACIATV